MIIEFAGVPGAGKTTIAAELANRLESNNITVNQPTANLAHETSAKRRIITKAKYAAHSLITSPRFAVQATKMLIDVRQKQKDMYIKNMYNLLFLQRIYRSAKDDQITVLDQGFLQVMWSIAYFSKRQMSQERIPTKIFESRGQEYHFVLIEASPDSTRERLAKREEDNKHPQKLEKRDSSAESISNYSYEVIKKLSRDMAAQENDISVSVFSNEEPADIDRIAGKLTKTVLE